MPFTARCPVCEGTGRVYPRNTIRLGGEMRPDELPKNPYLIRNLSHSNDARVAYGEAQQDMIKAGYRPMKSKEEIEEKLCELEYKWPLHSDEIAEIFHDWLYGDKE